MGTLAMRKPIYKCALILYLVGVILFIVGFASPKWIKYELTGTGTTVTNTSGNAGLWKNCYLDIQGEEQCTGTPTSGWMVTVNGLQGGAMAAIILTAAAGFYINYKMEALPSCWQQFAFHTGIGLGAALGGCGSAIYATKIAKDKNIFQESYDKMGKFTFTHELAWAFAINNTGSTIMFVAGILLRIFSKPRADYQQQQLQQQQQQNQNQAQLQTVASRH